MGKRKGKGRKQGVQKHRTNQKAENVTLVKEKPSGHHFPVPGLANLGNTCFFNAVVQNISQSHYFKERLERLIAKPSYQMELHLETPGNEVGLSLIVDEQPGPFVTAMNRFLGEMRNHGGRSLTPRGIFTEICKKAPRFRSHQQQDSQELLRHLLDAMRSEEIHRIRRAVLTVFNIGKNKPGAVSKLTDKDRAEIKAYGHQAARQHTFVDDIFGGKLISTVKCKECDTCSEVCESFLDLSLPIPEDKGVHVASPGGYQTRSKRNKRKGANEKEEGAPNPPTTPKDNVPSKHQQKKERKRQSKQSRRSKGKTQSLQEFLKEDGTPTEVSTENQDGGGAAEEDEGDRPFPVDEMDSGEASKEEHPSVVEVELTAEEEEVEWSPVVKTGEVADGEEVDHPPVDSDVTAIEADHVEKHNGTHSDSAAVAEEASSGKSQSNAEVLTDELVELKLDDNPAMEVMADTQTEKESNQGASLGPEPRKNGLLRSPQTLALQVEPRTEATGATPSWLDALRPASNDSLEACTIKFCSSELLTGNNKFACATCTGKKRELKRTAQDFTATTPGVNPTGGPCKASTTAESQREMADSKLTGGPCKASTTAEIQREMADSNLLLTTSEEAVNDTDKTDTITDSLESQKPDPYTASDLEVVATENLAATFASQEGAICQKTTSASLPDKDESVMEEEESGGSDTEDGRARSSTSEHEGTKESNHEEGSDGEDVTLLSEKEDDSKGNGDVVYSEAVKQLLIEKLPMVLCLHLKRFLHVGRQLRKNSRHVSFPTLMDMRPFCTPGYQGSCDSKGRVLYSLYGVVEHSGSMHGGHYTAYVRVRPPIKLDAETLGVGCGEQAETLSLGYGEQAETGEVAQTREDTLCGDHPTTTTATEYTAVNCAARTSLEYDMSSTGGVYWYYISDSRVRTATEAEVLKCQAYLLFYEKLPLHHQHV